MKPPTLLLLHGLVGSLDYFDPASRITGAKVTAIDLLGYGSLDYVKKDQLTLSRQADHAATCIANLGSDRLWLLAHSMGGAVAMILADRRPELVAGIINVEGNFTLYDAFWSRKIAAKSSQEWSAEYQALQEDVPGWVKRCGIEATAERVEWAAQILANQPASTVYAMSQAILHETSGPAFLDGVRRVVRCGLPYHLIAGERSAAAWDVPEFVRAAARSYTELPGAGHLMMLEDPDSFCRLVDSVLARCQVSPHILPDGPGSRYH